MMAFAIAAVAALPRRHYAKASTRRPQSLRTATPFSCTCRRAAGQRHGAAPLMIFLHGSGERGDNLDQVKLHGPSKIADRDPKFPFILVSPQLPADQDWDLARFDALLAWALKTLPADPDRVTLTGLSRGGHATWRWAAAEPWRFAAVAPVAGTGQPADACSLKALPVWAFHGDRDDVVVPEGSFAMVRALRACGGSAASDHLPGPWTQRLGSGLRRPGTLSLAARTTAAHQRQGQTNDPFPRRLPVGRGHRRLSDRRIAAGRWRGGKHLAALQPRSAADGEPRAIPATWPATITTGWRRTSR